MGARLFFWLSLLVAVSDVAMLFLALVAAYYLRFQTALFPIPEEIHFWSDYVSLAIAQSIAFPIVFGFRQMYHIQRNASRIDELVRVLMAVLIAGGLTLGVIALVTLDFPYSRLVIAIAWLSAVPMIWLARIMQYWLHGLLRRWRLGIAKVLVVGDGPVAFAVLDKLQHGPAWGYQVAGYITGPAPHPGFSMNGTPKLGTIEQLDALVRSYGITEVIVAEPSLEHQQLLDAIEQLDPHGVTVKVFPDEFQLLSSQVTLSDLNGLPLISVRDVAFRGSALMLKRMVDVAVSALILVLFSWFFLLIALLVKITSPNGPVFYVQERVGLDGRTFGVIKFRSMRPDAEVESGPVWATKADPHATPLGRFLRRFSLDETPQFVNVLLGDMSIVGPRPERPEFAEEFRQRIPNYWARHREKVGLTGWAQVNGLRGDTGIEERTAYDLWYVENWSLLLDFKIMIRTIPAMFRNNNG